MNRAWLRTLTVALAMGLLLASHLLAQEDMQFFPVSEIQPGLKGIGKTVFQGDTIEDFQVEFLGVLKNALAAKHDLIIARLSGGPLEKTGVIAGMSGSPVYVDGKLVGAVAISFPFSKEPLAGITPIADMLQVVPTPPTAAPAANPVASLRIAPIPGSSAIGRFIPDDENPLERWTKVLDTGDHEGDFIGLRLPLRSGGFPSEVLRDHAPIFRRLGLELTQGAVLSGGEDRPLGKSDLLPGSMISLLLVRGDLNLNVDCTVTYRRGNELFACGHRFIMTGPTKIPFATSRVITAVPNLASSFKLDAPGPLAGVITQDRFGAIYGVVGEKTSQIPVHVRLQSGLNRTEEYNLEIIQDPFLSPLLLNVALISTLSATERAIGPATLELKGKIRLAGNDPVEIEDVISGDVNTPNSAALTFAAPFAILMGTSFPDLHVEGVDISVAASTEKRVATIEQVWSSKSEVAPGDKIEVTALLRTPTGEIIVHKLPVQIPESVRDRNLSLVVGSGAAINALQARFSALNATPRNLQQLVEALNKMRRNNCLYALLLAPQRSLVMQGDEYPSPPPSLLQTFLSDPAVSSSVSFSGTSVVGDFENKPVSMNIRGQKTLLLKVVQSGE
ncbi:MAG: SpoIVB peptidase S55 domain-containing protein [Terriglobia bacterium]